MTYILWSSNLASCLENYSLTWDDRSVSLRDWPCKLYVCQIPIYLGPLVLVFVSHLGIWSSYTCGRVVVIFMAQRYPLHINEVI